MAFSEQLRKLRQNQGLSQEQLADLVGATTQEVVRWEIGLARPERDKVLRLARLLGCKPEELLPEEPLPNRPPEVVPEEVEPPKPMPPAGPQPMLLPVP